MNTLEAIKCNFCENNQAEELYILSDLRLNYAGNWVLYKCVNCGLLFISPKPDWSELQKHYPVTYHGYLQNGSGLLNALRQFGLQQRVKPFRKLVNGRGLLLDVGCATGDFLQKFRDTTGWDVCGVEIVPEAALIARNKGLRIIDQELTQASLQADSYDVITLWDVLEHVENPKDTLEECKRLLKPGGLLVIKTPDPEGLEAKLFKQFWIGYEAPQHIFGFPKHVLFDKLIKMNFDVSIKQTGSDYTAFFLSLAYWLRSKKQIRLSKMLISSLRSIPGRLIAGILVRPMRWFGIKSSCTYYATKKITSRER